MAKTKSLKIPSNPTDVDAYMWELRQKGKTIDYIAKHVNRTFRVVAGRLRDIAEDLYKSQLDEIKAQQSMQIAQLDFIIQCAMDQWEKSCNDDEEIEIYSKFKSSKKGNGEFKPQNQRVLKRSSYGDSTYLAIILKAQADKRKLLGIETGKPELEPMDAEQIVRFMIPDDGRNAK